MTNPLDEMDSAPAEMAEEPAPSRFFSKKAEPPKKQMPSGPITSDEDPRNFEPIGDLEDEKPYLSLREKGKRQRRFYAEQPLVKFLIPRDQDDKSKKNPKRRFSVNGYVFYIRKGAMLDVPMQVAEMIAEMYELDAKALESPYRFDMHEKGAAAEQMLGGR